VGIYTIGLALARDPHGHVVWVANTSLLWAPGIPLGLVVLAIAQMGVHLVFFLHITTGPDNTNNVLAWRSASSSCSLVVVGSLLDHDKSERQHDAASRADEYAKCSTDRKDKTTRSSYGRGGTMEAAVLTATRRIATF